MSTTTIKATIVSILGCSDEALKVQLSTIVGETEEPKTAKVLISTQQNFEAPLEVVVEERLFDSEEVLELSVDEAGTYVLQTKADIQAELAADDLEIRKAVALSGDAGAPVKAPEGLAKTIAAKSAAAGQGCSYAERTPYTF